MGATQTESGKTARTTGGRPKAANNSGKRAKRGADYEPEAKPKDIKTLVDTINMWGFYLMAWGKKVDDAADDVEDRLLALEGKPPRAAAGVAATTHLDPPMQPYNPPPSD